MIDRNIDAYVIQETWLTGNWEKTIHDYLIIHHNHGVEKGKEYKSKKQKKKKGRENCGIAIILSLNFRHAYERAGSPKPIRSASKGKHSGRFLGVTLQFPNFNSFNKKIKGDLKVTLASVYNPHVEKQYQGFNNYLTSLVTQIPSNAEIIFGQDINANVGIRSENDKWEEVIGPNGFDNRNQKGEWALQWLASNNMKVANSFFTHSSYLTHRSHLPPKAPQMLDVFSVSSSSFKRVRNCKTYKGISSDHEAVELHLSLTQIKHSGDSSLSKGVIDWDKIMHDEPTRLAFNNNLEKLNNEIIGLTYSQFFENVMRAGSETAMKVIAPDKGWFEDEKELLQPAIDEKNELLSELRKLSNDAKDAFDSLKLKLKDATNLLRIKLRSQRQTGTGNRQY